MVIDFDAQARIRQEFTGDLAALEAAIRSTRAGGPTALYNAHYIAAVILHDRALTLSQFEPARYDDPALRRFTAERVEVVADPSLSEAQAIAEIVTANGKTVSEKCEYPLGAPENPVSYADIEAKFRTYAPARLSAAQVEATLQAVARIEEIPSARAFVAGLRPAILRDAQVA
jgi:2-methylcitrate dehydratase